MSLCRLFDFMKPNHTGQRSLLAGLAACCLGVALASAQACGVQWKKPTNHFDGVNEFGNVDYFDEIGRIDLGEGIEFPLIIGFRSDWQRKSPYLGQGWIVALLDSHFVQREANAFTMISPDGYTFSFGREPKNPSILSGNRGWKGEIKGNTITVHATCGWSLEFQNGLLTKMSTPKNQVVEIRRDREGVAQDVVSGATRLLKVERDFQGNVVGLTLGNDGEAIKLEQVERPIVQTIAGQNVVGGKAQSIGLIEEVDGTKKEYRYGVTEKLEPTIEVVSADGNTRKISWNPETKRILSDGDWKYEIEPSAVVGHNAAIGRTNDRGGKEFWHYDLLKSEEYFKNLNGHTTVKKWFNSGKLAGKLRSIETKNDSVTLYSKKFGYDDKARLIRITENGESTEFIYDNYSNIVEQRLNGQAVMQRTYDAQGRLDTEQFSDGSRRLISYSAERIIQTSIDPTGLSTSAEIFNFQENISENQDVIKSISDTVSPYIEILNQYISKN